MSDKFLMHIVNFFTMHFPVRDHSSPFKETKCVSALVQIDKKKFIAFLAKCVYRRDSVSFFSAGPAHNCTVIFTSHFCLSTHSWSLHS